MFGEGGWMGAGMWLFWVLLIVIIVALVKVVGPVAGSTPTNPDKNPMEILRARYARGEIDEEEFERRRQELEK